MRTSALAVATAALVTASASASMDTLSDTELVSRVAAILSVKEGPGDRIVGIHRDARVVVDVRCGDVCPANTVRIVHYDVPPGPDCARIGGDVAAVGVPVSIAVNLQDFCIPHILYQRKRYTDRPYQR